MSRPLVEITGFRELQEKLKRLANDRQKRAEILKVLRKVAQGTVRVARQTAPVSKRPHIVSGKRTKKTIQPGALRKSIGVITGRKGQAKDNPTVYVGPRAKGNFDGFYGHFVEYGHNVYASDFKRKRSSSDKARAHNNAGAKSRTTANPFMKETYDTTKGQVTQETVKSVEKVIQKSIDRLSR
jgi:HK97 gp10 family phage protein